MQTFIALFRGINVGGNNILPMKELAALFESLSCQRVRTYIQSGNVVFESEELPTKLVQLVQQKFGFEPQVLFLGETEFLESVAGNPYEAEKGNQLHFFFCEDVPNANIEKLQALQTQSERFLIKGKVLYLYAPDGIGRSKLAANIERQLGVPTTARNLNTVNKLIGMLKSD